MAIPEAQLVTWSHQGASGPSRDTYASVKGVLESGNAPYAMHSPDVFLQGSYANDTNVARDSDVDVVALIDSTFAHDAQTMQAEDYAAFERGYPGSAGYTYSHYRADVSRWLIENYGNGVDPAGKAILVPANQNRRECDVLPAIEYRYYYKFKSIQDQNYVSGICFYLADGTQIVNFPKQHATNCTQKHQRTGEWFKKVVRVYKNMRNYLADHGAIPDGLAPSYFIEGMLFNVPDDRFGRSFDDSFVETFNFLNNADRTEFRCANGIHSLLGSTPVTWRADNCQAFLSALRTLWNGWANR
ncbi:nucleotidyltransferase domain-containing protein [Sphingopyxis sp. NJF-3]